MSVEFKAHVVGDDHAKDEEAIRAEFEQVLASAVTSSASDLQIIEKIRQLIIINGGLPSESEQVRSFVHTYYYC